MRRRGRGMTLIDVLVALAVLSLGSLGVLAASLSLLQGNAQARLLTEATAVGRDAMERLMVATTPQSGGDVVDRQGQRGARATAPGGLLFTRTWTVTGGTPLRLQVTVQFNDARGRTHQVVLDGLR